MLMRYAEMELALKPQLSYGATAINGSVRFSVFSESATGMRVLLYDRVRDTEPAEVIQFDPDDRVGNVWNTVVRGLGPGQLYHLQADGPRQPERGMWFDGKARLIDPYAMALVGDFQRSSDGVLRPPKCVTVDHSFDWEDDKQPRWDLSESIIYEMHVAGFTKSSTSGVERPGSYLGVTEKIDHLKSLGVTAVELLPVHEFPIRGPKGKKLTRPNYWGYDPMAFFSPHRGYAADRKPGAQVDEFKEMVKQLHKAKIEVILDVVFNHTCEGNDHGPVISFKGLENRAYYMTDETGKYYKNYSGCGNTLNCNHPVVRKMIIECLQHWVLNYHVDGFRFDLASILNRFQDGHLANMSPLVEEISADPILANTKIIAEAWDAGGAYQVGHFGDARWAEWNGRYRDDVRRYWRGDGGFRGALATRLAGSSDMYGHHRHPYCSVNFITSHDGFTMNDMVSYRHKHNEANGEGNRDGDNNNFSENYGHEGPSADPILDALRERQIKNLLTTLMLSQGVPMLVSGDECRRTQNGNNNAYCQDSDISWFDWSLVKQNRGMVRFFRSLARFRRAHQTVRRTRFLTGQPDGHDDLPDVQWYNFNGCKITDWHNGDMMLTCLLTAPQAEDGDGRDGRDLLLMLNPTDRMHTCKFPSHLTMNNWRLYINTAAREPEDIYPDFDGPHPKESATLSLAKRSLLCWVTEE